MNRALNALGIVAAHWQNPVDMRLLTTRDFPLFDAFTDIPVSADFESIYEQYPEAKFILTERPLEGWVQSVRRHYQTEIGVQNPQDLDAPRVACRQGGLAVEIDRKLYTRFESWDAAYTAYHERVRAFFEARPEAQFLSFSVFAGHGWPELCAFLDRPEPSKPFPHANAARN